MPIQQIDESGFSRNYGLLADLMKDQSVICVVNHAYSHQIEDGEEVYRKVATTRYNSSFLYRYALSSPGITYISAKSENEFCNYCLDLDLSFVVPLSETEGN